MTEQERKQLIAQLEENIPDEMKAAARWTHYNSAKRPYSPKAPYGSEWSKPDNWLTFAEAVKGIGSVYGLGEACGVGFMLGDGWAGVDLDGASHKGKKPVSDALLKHFGQLNTYGEYSKSGTGYHFIGRYSGPVLSPSEIDTKGNERIPGSGNVEIYTSIKFFALTGKAYPEKKAPADITLGLQLLHGQYIAAEAAAQAAPAAQKAAPARILPGSTDTEVFLKENLSDMLAAIPADCSREEWLKVGMALKAEGLPFDVWDSWSSTGAGKYDGSTKTQRIWNSFKRSGVSGAYITKLAQGYGWKPQRATAAQDFKGLTVYPAAAPAQPAADPGEATPAESPYKNGLDLYRDFKKTVSDPDYKPLPVGFPALDKALNGGILPGSLCIVCGASSTGKSALVMQIAERTAEIEGRDVVVLSFEMSKEQLIARSLARITYQISPVGAVPNQEAMLANQWHTLPDIQQKQLAQAEQRKDGYYGRIFIDDCVTSNIDDVLKKLNQHTAATGKAPVVIVDYLQLFNVPKGMSMAEGLGTITKAFRQFAMQYKTVVWLVSAVSRTAQRTGELDMTAGFGSSFVEYSGDYLFTFEYIVAAVNSKAKLSKWKKFAHREMQLTVQKARMGAVGDSFGYNFEAPYSFFKEMTQKEYTDAQERLKKDPNPAAAAPGSTGADPGKKITKTI